MQPFYRLNARDGHALLGRGLRVRLAAALNDDLGAEGFDPDSVVLPMVSQGWPELLSSLKTLLETGEVPAPELAARR